MKIIIELDSGERHEFIDPDMRVYELRYDGADILALQPKWTRVNVELIFATTVDNARWGVSSTVDRN